MYEWNASYDDNVFGYQLVDRFEECIALLFNAVLMFSLEPFTVKTLVGREDDTHH